MKPTNIKRFVFNYPTHAVIWTVFENASNEPENKATPFSNEMDSADGGRVVVYCDFYHTLARAQENAMKDYTDYLSLREYFTPVEVWHMYEDTPENSNYVFYDGR
jgi:hypothetical protein